jgi:hypothetical protein
MVEKSNENSNSQGSEDFFKLGFNEKIQKIKQTFLDCDDLIVTEFSINPRKSEKNCIIYFNKLADKKQIQNYIITPLYKVIETQKLSFNSITELIQSTGILSNQFDKVSNYNKIIEYILEGNVIFLSSNTCDVYSINSPNILQREIAIPLNERTTGGAQLAYIEDIDTNTALIRSIIHSNRFKVKSFKVGRYTKTKISIVYMADLAPVDLVDSIISKLNDIHVDSVIDISNIKEILEEKNLNFLPKVILTEKLDKTIGNLMEGTIAILVDRSSQALILPITFISFFQGEDDYNLSPIIAIFMRLIRFFSFFLSITITSIYVAITEFHYEILPFKMIVNFGEAIAPIPLPSVAEALIIETFSEILRESSSRFSGSTGPFIGILGAVLVGEAAIRAKIVSPLLVIFVAVSVISSFAMPNYFAANILRILKFPMIFFAGILGGIGIAYGWCIILIYLCSIDSFGVPYMSGIAPFRWDSMQDILYRAPFTKMKKRPQSIQNEDRMKNNPKKGWWDNG